MYCISSSLAWYSSDVHVNLMEGGNPWYSLLIYSLISIILIPSIAAFGAVITHGGYKRIVNLFFSEAWKDLTVEVESADMIVEAPFEGELCT